MKFGYQGGYLVDNRKEFSNNQELTYRTQNGVPDQFTETINRFPQSQRVRFDAFYAQEAWTRGRLTLQGALRLDHRLELLSRGADRRRADSCRR